MSDLHVVAWYVVCWLGVVFAGGALAFPLVSRLCAPLPREGAGFTFAAALVVVTWTAFLVGQLSFGPLAIAGGVVALVATAVRFRSGATEWRALGETGAVFAVGFLVVVGLQFLHVGVVPLHEHFLNYAVFNALRGAPSLPPEDVWFAGEPLRYYYGGHLGAVVLATLTDTPSRYAFSLSLATYFGLLLAAVYELGGSIAARNGRSRRAAGSLAVFFVGFAGNLFLPLVAVLDRLPDPVADPVTRAVSPGFSAGARNTLRGGVDSFTYWDAFFTLEEGFSPFPLYLWIHGELHAHMMSAPFLVAFVGLLYGYYCSDERAFRRRRLLVFGAVPAAIGFLTTVELWSLPTALGVTLLTLLFAPARPSTLLHPADRWSERVTDGNCPLGREGLRYAGTLVAVGGVTLAALVAALPFFFGMAGGSENTVRLVREAQRTALAPLLVTQGLFLLATGAALVRFRREIASQPVRRALVVLTVAGAALAAAVDPVPATVVLVPFLLVPWYALRATRIRTFAAVLVVAAVGLVALTDVVYVEVVEDVLTGRVNTVFKLYMHAWLFWGVASGALVARLLPSTDSLDSRGAASLPDAGSAVVVILVVTGSTYGLVATSHQFDRATASEPIDDPVPIPAALDSATESRSYDDAAFLVGENAIHNGDAIVASIRDAPPGELLWSGPYVGLLAGEYVAEFHLNVSGETDESIATVDVVAGAADASTAYRSIGEETVSVGDDGVVSVRFDLVRTVKDIEFRGRAADGNGTVELDHVTVEPVGDRSGRDLEEHSGPSLDAERFGAAIHPAEYDAARWLEGHATGRPTIATAPGSRWQWDSAISVYTGFPTVLGWAHQMGYHGREAYQDRLEDADALYVGTPAERASLLAEYDVEYVVVGPVERDRYGDLRPFSELPAVSLVYDEDGVTIYEVDLDRVSSLPADSTSGSEASANDAVERSAHYDATDFDAAGGAERNVDPDRITATGNSSVWHGPWQRLHPGTYEITYYLDADVGDDGEETPAVVLETLAGTTDLHGEVTVYAEREVSETDGVRAVTDRFILEQSRRDVEFRGRPLGPGATVDFHGVALVRTDGLEHDPVEYDGTELVTASANGTRASDDVDGADDGIVSVRSEGDGNRSVWWGPYDAYEPGTYEVTFDLAITEVEADADASVLDVEVGIGGRHAPATTFESLNRTSVPAMEGTHSVTIPFELEERATDLEFRGLEGESAGTVEVREVTVEKRG